jgi:hypothetical protein
MEQYACHCGAANCRGTMLVLPKKKRAAGKAGKASKGKKGTKGNTGTKR